MTKAASMRGDRWLTTAATLLAGLCLAACGDGGDGAASAARPDASRPAGVDGEVVVAAEGAARFDESGRLITDDAAESASDEPETLDPSEEARARRAATEREMLELDRRLAEFKQEGGAGRSRPVVLTSHESPEAFAEIVDSSFLGVHNPWLGTIPPPWDERAWRWFDWVNRGAKSTRRLSNGVRYWVFHHGDPDGPVVEPDSVVDVFYSSFLVRAGGLPFGGMGVRQTPFRLTLGRGEQVLGWELGMHGMRVGEVRKILVPAYLGYGEGLSGRLANIGKSDLEYVVRVMDIKKPMRIEPLEAGEGPWARFGDRIRVHYELHNARGERIEAIDGDDPPVAFTVGGDEVIAGLDEGVLGLRAGGRSVLRIPGWLAFGSDGLPRPGHDPDPSAFKPDGEPDRGPTPSATAAVESWVAAADGAGAATSEADPWRVRPDEPVTITVTLLDFESRNAVTYPEPVTLPDDMRELGGGLKVKTLRAGMPRAETVQPGRYVAINAHGRLLDGTVFFSTGLEGTRQEPVVFTPGAGHVVEGLERGLLGAVQGERRLIVMPPDLASAELGPGETRPAGQTLVWDVTVLRVEPGFNLEVLEAGETADTLPAAHGDTVRLHYKASLAPSGQVVDSTEGKPPFIYTVGSSEAIEGWGPAVRGMRPGERRRVRVPAWLAYDRIGLGEIVPPRTDMVFELELTEIVERDAVPHLSDPVAPSFEANVETPAGLRYTVVEPGQGRSATSGDEVVVSYTLWHADGRFIDDSASRRHPHTLKLGVSTDLRLLHEAAVGMRPGERRYVKAPASFAEGAREVGLFISPDQPLVIDLTLESILTRDSDVDPDA